MTTYNHVVFAWTDAEEFTDVAEKHNIEVVPAIIVLHVSYFNQSLLERKMKCFKIPILRNFWKSSRSRILTTENGSKMRRRELLEKLSR